MCRSDPRATCSTCRWCDREDEPWTCRAALPVIGKTMRGVWPRVAFDQWCGQHQYHIPRSGVFQPSCAACGGMGEVYPQLANEPVRCPQCGGTGAIPEVSDEA